MATLLSLALSAGLVGAASDMEVAGRILDAGGQPVANVTLSGDWMFRDGRCEPEESVTSKADGSFRGTIDLPSFDEGETYLVAYSADRTQAGVVFFDADSRMDLDVVVQPAVGVRGQVLYEGADRGPAWMGCNFKLRGRRVVDTTNTTGRVEVRLPPGQYEWVMFDRDLIPVHGTVHLKPASKTVDLGTTRLPMSFLSRHLGKVPPEWNVTAARNVGEGQGLLAEFRGRWVLIEFWNFT